VPMASDSYSPRSHKQFPRDWDKSSHPADNRSIKSHAKLVHFPDLASLSVRDDRVLLNLHLVDIVAKDMQAKLPRRFELDDLKGAGCIGLIHAAERYQAPRCKVPFWVFAKLRIHDAIMDSVRCGGDHRLRDGELVEMPAADRAGGGLAHHLTERNEQRRDIRQARLSLCADELAMIDRHYFGLETSIRAAGEELGLKRSDASRLHRRALDHMRRHMELRGRKAA